MKTLTLLITLVVACAGLPAHRPNADGPLRDLLPDVAAERRERAFARVGASGDERWLAPLADLLRFASTPEEWYRVLDTAGAILGEDLREIEQPWRTLTLRLAARETSLVPEGYAGWKGELLGQLVDPRFRELLYDGVQSRVRLDEVVWGGVAVDGIPALEDPLFVAAEEAGYLRDDEPVFGVALNGDARAYPLRIVDWHEMVNDTVGGEAVSLAYCTLCGAGVLYRGTLGERTFRFGSSGLLMRSNKLMFDRETRSLWNQLTGEPVIGELARSGLRLEVLPSVVTTWGAWRARHPETTVLDLDTGWERDYSPGAAYGEYFGSAELMFPAHRPDGSAAGPGDKARVFVVRLDDAAATWPVDELRRRRVANERVGERAIVVVSDDAAGTATVPDGWPEPLDGEVLGAFLEADPARVRELTPELLLALPAEQRLPLLDRLVERNGDDELLALRDEVAQRGLVGETRAFERGDRRFAAGDEAGTLVDAEAGVWRVTEEALVGPNDERLVRLPGHLAFAFARDAFFGR